MRAQTFQCLVEGFDDVPPIDCLFLASRDPDSTKQAHKSWRIRAGHGNPPMYIHLKIIYSGRGTNLSLCDQLVESHFGEVSLFLLELVDRPISASYPYFSWLISAFTPLKNPEFKFLLRQCSKANFLGVLLGFREAVDVEDFYATPKCHGILHHLSSRTMVISWVFPNSKPIPYDQLRPTARRRPGSSHPPGTSSSLCQTSDPPTQGGSGGTCWHWGWNPKSPLQRGHGGM